MPRASENSVSTKSVLLTGVSGVGKSTIALSAGGPIAALLLDKSSIDVPPGIDGSDIYFKTYPPATVDLSKDDHGRARNIADTIIKDIQLIRDHFTIGKKLEVPMFNGAKEEWPTPKTLVIEGGDFLAQHILNLICARHSKKGPGDFDNPFEAWGLRLAELQSLYDMLTYLPCNLVVTTGPEEETKSSRVNGKLVSEKTGVIMPDLGGAMCVEGPRKFQSSLFVYSEGNKYYVRTRSDSKYRGFKLGGRFGEQEKVEITIGKEKQENLWHKLFSNQSA